MKKFYLIFFISFIILSVLLYISTVWFLAGVGVIVLLTSYDYYRSKLKVFTETKASLEIQVEELQRQLDNSLRKAEKATKEAIQVRVAKQELVTTINHEIRTPMNGVLGTSMLLESTTLTKEQQEYIDTIKRSGENLLNAVNDILVKDLLDYSKLDNRGKKLNPKNFNLLDTVEEVMNMFAVTSTKNSIELVADIEEKSSLQLNGDNKRLREILMNLLENAVKFTRHGEVLLKVQCLVDSEKPVFCFEVVDTGIGISDDEMKTLFYSKPSRGFQEHTAKPNRGLVICRQHAELMGGKIEVKSKPGTGSTFTFTVSFDQASVPKTSDEQSHINKLAGKNVLIVDDNATFRNILLRQLKAWQMQPAGNDSAISALEKLSDAANYDLVLVDINMPQMDGLQFARAVKKMHPYLPVVLMNIAWNESYKLEKELFAALLMKPIRQHVLRDVLVSLFNQNDNEHKQAAVNGINTMLADNDFAKRNPYKILVAEDNLVNQRIAIKILNKLGYDPQIANNGKEACEMLVNENYDLILMDVQMPGMDGMEATKQIRSNQIKQPVIIAMTANVMHGDRDACLQAGMDDYLSKPFVMNDLLSKLEKWSGRRGRSEV